MLDSITYSTTITSVLRAGFITFPISPRNSPAVVAHLLSKVNVAHVLVGRDKLMQDLAREALNLMRAQYPHSTIPTTSNMPTFEDHFQARDQDALESKCNVHNIHHDLNSETTVVLYLHSSGKALFSSVLLQLPLIALEPRLDRLPQGHPVDASKAH